MTLTKDLACRLGRELPQRSSPRHAASGKGRTPVSRSFRLKSEALLWAREQELEADQSRPQVHKTLKRIAVADIVSGYRDEVVPRKRGADREILTLNAFLRHPLAQVALSDVTAGVVSAYCAERLRRVKAGTFNRELDILRYAFATARRSWDVLYDPTKTLMAAPSRAICYRQRAAS